METVLYADILFLVNFAMDFISLSAAASLGAKAKNTLKISIASALGAIYAIFATISTLDHYINYIIAIIVGAAMCTICFGYSGLFSFVRQYTVFWCCSALLGGIMTALLTLGNWKQSTPGIISMVLASVGIMIFMIKAIRDRVGCKSLRIKITLKGKTIVFDALCDSGNLLRDPFSGTPVIIASHEVLSSILPKETIDSMLGGYDEVLHKDLKIRLIPQNREDGNSLLCAFFPDNIQVSGAHSASQAKCLIAVSPHNSTYFAGFAATAPSILIP